MLRWLALTALLSSTTIPTFTPRQLVDRSDLVARVVVRSHESAWVGRKILTFYDLDVVDAWSSHDPQAPRRALVAMPGGIVGALGQAVPGTPVLEDAHAYVLCMSRGVGPRGARAVIGLWQGVWAIDQAGALHGFTHAGPDVDTLPLDALRARLLEAAP